MTELSFGSILRNARNQQGYDLNVVARRLRIRPDILDAIEEGDFSRMPPRGYTRNMVNAYARFLGLNSTDITHKYLDDYYAYQVHEARTSNTLQSKRFDIPSETRTRRVANPSESTQDHLRTGRQPQVAAPGRTLFTSARDSSDFNQVPLRQQSSSETRTHRANRGALPTTQYTNFYSGPKANSRVSSKLPFIIAGVVIAVLLIIILVLVFGPKGDDGNNSTNNIPVNGVSEVGVPSDTLADEDSSTQNVITKKAPVDFTFNFTIADGESAYVEVYVDGVIDVADTLSGPIEKSYRSAGTIRFITSNPAPIKAFVDGEPVALEDGSAGIVDVTYDFANILAQWNADNPTVSAGNNAGANSGDPSGTATNNSTVTTTE